MDKRLEKTAGQNFTVAHAGRWDELGGFVFRHPRLPYEAPGKVFLKNELGLTGMEVSFGKLPAGASIPFYHKHREHEELYIIVKGRGQFQIDDEVIDVSEGTAVRVAPGGVRTWRNNSSEDLCYIVVQAKEGSLAGEETSDGVGVGQSVRWPE